MKSLLRLIVSVMLIGLLSAAPKLTKEQANELGTLILSTHENKKYRGIFKGDKPYFDTKRNLWVYHYGFPVTSGNSDHYIFEIRDEDGHYRLGMITANSPKPPRIHLPPNLKRKVNRLLESFTAKSEKISLTRRCDP